MQTIYQQEGFKDRRDYLNSLAQDYNLHRLAVYQAAHMLGESEDFDGLISTLEDLGDAQENERYAA